MQKINENIPENKIRDEMYIKRVLEENRKKSNGMRQSIRLYALENHSWEKIVEKYVGIIEEIIK